MWCRKGIQLVNRYRLSNKSILLLRRSSEYQNVRTLTGGPIWVSDEVREAVDNKQPVIALESTIITHGMPVPENLHTALSVEQIARNHGVTPATIGIIKGKVKVGLSNEDLEFLSEERSKTVKTSRRDMPYVLSQGLSGGTTVSGTMIAAHRAGIHMFVTGGIGGVHRGAELSMDVSADLTELGRTPVAVISAGVKSILDIGRTLEYLETEGVCVASYGPTKDFPAFFTRKSGFEASYNVENPLSAAQMIKSSLDCNLGSGLLLAVPIPEEHAVDQEQIDNAVKQAVFEAESQGVQGKEVTPFILSRVNEIMGGLSLQSNIALVKNNAVVGSQIACELSNLLKASQDITVSSLPSQGVSLSTQMSSPGRDDSMWNHCIPSKDPPKHAPGPGKVVVVGGVNVDLSVKFGVDSPTPNGATYPGTIKQTYGGVGRNMADCLARVGKVPLFISAVGADSYGDLFYKECSQLGLQPVRQVKGYTTSTYCAVIKNKGEVMYGVGDFNAHQKITPQYVSNFKRDLKRAPLVFLDGNIPAETMQYICEVCHEKDVPVWFDPADIHLIDKLFQSDAWLHLTILSPNLNELRVFCAKTVNKDVSCSSIARNTENSLEETLEETLEEGVELARVACKYTPVVLLTLGKHGVLICRSSPQDKPLLHTRCQPEAFSAVHYPLPPGDYMTTDIVSVSGAGDCLSGAFLSGILSSESEEVAIKQGLLAAQLSLKSTHAVPGSITSKNISLDNVPNHQEKWKSRVMASC